jgi:hypothetical protein
VASSGATTPSSVVRAIQLAGTWRPEREWLHPTTLRRLRLVVLGVYIGLLGMAYRTWPQYETSPDWILWRALPEAIAQGRIYDTATEAPFVWSPVAAWLMAIAAQFYWPWAIAHVAAVFLIRDWRLIVLVFLSWGFWTSTASGAPFIFVFVAGVLGLQGRFGGAIAYLALTLLMPRPVQIPLALGLLWRMPSTRWPFVALFILHGVIVLWSGYMGDWIRAMFGHALPAGNWGPTSVIGLWWLALGVPLGIWLTLRGNFGLAGLAISPYWLPEYLMMGLLDLVPPRRRPIDRTRARATEAVTPGVVEIEAPS